MLRFILLSILLTILLRAISRLWSGVVRGMQGPQVSERRTGSSSRVPQRGVQMERDPICGTFVIPERAIALSTSGGERLYFCSQDCRDKFRSGQPSTRPAHAHGPTA